MRVKDILSESSKLIRILWMYIEEEQHSSISGGWNDVLNYRNMNKDKRLMNSKFGFKERK